MSTKPVNITKGKVGTGTSGFAHSISGFIAGGVAVVDKLVLATPYTIYSTDDAIALGITAAYDTANSVIVHHHIAEFYRMAGEGTELNIMIIAQSVLPSAVFADVDALYFKKLANHAKGEIRQYGYAFNPVTGYTETITDGINSDIRACIDDAQAFALWTQDTYQPAQVLIEGRAYGGNAVSALNLRDIEISEGITLEADKVSMIIGQDYDFAEGLGWALGKKYASVGTALGTLASIAVNKDIGEVEAINLTDAVRGKFVNAGLSNHTQIKDNASSLETLDGKGYIFPIIHTGISGYRWNGDHVCTPEIVDDEGNMNENTIAYGRTMDDAIRKIRVKFLPKVRSVQPVELETGKLPIGVVAYFNSLGNDVFENMQGDGLISAGNTITDPDSDLLTGDKELAVDFVLQPTGTINKIQGKINIKKTL